MPASPLSLALALVSYPLRLAASRAGGAAKPSTARVVVISTGERRPG